MRQRVISSPYMFNVYMDNLNQSHNCCKTDCLSGEIMINHLMYADDLLLLSPSANGLRESLRACARIIVRSMLYYITVRRVVL